MSIGAQSGALSATWCGGALPARPADPACPDSPVVQITWPSRLDLAVTTGRNSRGKVWFDTENRKWNKPPCCQMTSACTPSVLVQKDTHRREGALGTSHAPPSLCRCAKTTMPPAASGVIAQGPARCPRPPGRGRVSYVPRASLLRC